MRIRGRGPDLAAAVPTFVASRYSARRIKTKKDGEREREGERGRDRERQRDREREGESVITRIMKFLCISLPSLCAVRVNLIV